MATKKTISKYTKSQIVGSTRYKNRRDLLAAILDDNTSYSHGEVEKALTAYLTQEHGGKAKKPAPEAEPKEAPPEGVQEEEVE